MRKRLAATAVAATMLGGGAAAVLAAPVVAGAETPAATTAATDTTDRPAPGAWVDDALAPLVKDGTLTQAQVDAVTEALDAARPEGPGGPGRGHGPGLAAAATALGMDEDALRTELQAGKTIAEVAKAEGVDVQTVVDAIVADMKSHLAQAVTDGRMTQAQADERAAQAAEHATALVNGERPAGPPPFAPGGAGEGFGTTS
jgi:hypothetical protein